MKHILQTTLAGLLLLTTETSFAQTPDAATTRALDYVGNLNIECTLGDGYQCEPVSEMQLTVEPQRLVPAEHLEIWPLVYVDFKSMDELSEAQKQFKHYKIGFGEDAQNYIVILSALLLPEVNEAGETTGLLRSTLGKSMRYLIDKTSMQIVSRQYYR